MNVALYMRYSCDKQDEQSIEGQNRVCEEYCRRNGYTIVRKYIDRAASASKNIDKRVEFLRMIGDSGKHLFEAVVVYKLDRFARNRYDSAVYKAKLKANGVKIMSAMEDIGDTPESIILESVIEGYNEYYSRELSQKVKRGMKESALKGNSTGGAVPLGYKLDNKKLVEDESKSSIVKEIFRRFSEGEPLTEIARSLNSRGHRTAAGAEYTINSFHRILTNRKYIGVYTYNGEVEIEGGCPAIVDKELFDTVQKILSEHQKRPSRGRATTDYILAGKLFCGMCGALMVGDSVKKGDIRYYYYACGKRKKHRTCEKKSISKDKLEDAVIDDCVKMLTAENIDLIANIAEREYNRRKNNDTEMNNLVNKLSEIDKSINNLVKVIESGIMSDAVLNRLTALEAQQQQVKSEIEVKQAGRIDFNKDKIIFWLNQFANGDKSDIVYRKRLIKMLIRKIFVYDTPEGTKLNIIWQLSNFSHSESSSDGSSDMPSSGSPIVQNKNEEMEGSISVSPFLFSLFKSCQKIQKFQKGQLWHQQILADKNFGKKFKPPTSRRTSKTWHYC